MGNDWLEKDYTVDRDTSSKSRFNRRDAAIGFFMATTASLIGTGVWISDRAAEDAQEDIANSTEYAGNGTETSATTETVQNSYSGYGFDEVGAALDGAADQMARQAATISVEYSEEILEGAQYMSDAFEILH